MVKETDEVVGKTRRNGKIHRRAHSKQSYKENKRVRERKEEEE
jgi:hypothetical protein